MRTTALVFLFALLAPLSAAASQQVKPTTARKPAQSLVKREKVKVNASLKQVVGIIGSLNLTENGVLENSDAFKNNRKEIANIIQSLAKLWRVDQPQLSNERDYAHALNLIENRILLQYALNRPLYKAYLKETVTQTKKLCAMMAPPDCDCGFCLEDGLCVPCWFCEF